MTCIIGAVQKGVVYIGADSLGSDGHHVSMRRDSKVFRRKGFVIGYTSSFRMGQLLRYGLDATPPVRCRDPLGYMVRHFVPAVRKCLKAGGYLRKKNEVETGGTFLVGWKGHLFGIDDDLQVMESLRLFDAVGHGYRPALGAMHALVAGRGEGPGWMWILAGLRAAVEFDPYVRPPFRMLSTKGGEKEWPE